MGLKDSIRQAARSNGTKLQGTDAAKMEKLCNNLFFLEKNIDEEVKFLRQVMTRGAESQKRVGLHASNMLVGPKEYCPRALVLSLLYEQLQGEEISPGLKRIFEEGNAVHEKWQRMFIRAGWSKAEQLDFTQYNEEYMMSFTPDIICSIPEMFDGELMVGEIKSVNTYQFQKMIKHPSAWKQCQWYMHLTGLKKGFVLCDDKNTQDFKLEVYDYDSELVAPFIERAEEVMFHYDRVVSSGKMVKRPDDATAYDCKRCEKCNMKDACWNKGMGRVRLK